MGIESIKVKIKLAGLGIVTTHEERQGIYRLLSEKTGGLFPNAAMDVVDDETFKEIVKEAKELARQKAIEREKTRGAHKKKRRKR